MTETAYLRVGGARPPELLCWRLGTLLSPPQLGECLIVPPHLAGLNSPRDCLVRNGRGFRSGRDFRCGRGFPMTGRRCWGAVMLMTSLVRFYYDRRSRAGHTRPRLETLPSRQLVTSVSGAPGAAGEVPGAGAA